MKELIVSNKDFSGDKVQTVDARDLHEFLGSKKQFADWVKVKVVENVFFSEDQDYVLLHRSVKQTGRGGHNRKDYHLTMDTAKKVSMAEQTEAGNKARDYLISIQNKAEKIIKAVENVEYKGNIGGIVFSRCGVGYTSSRLIARKFGKRHADVIRAVESLINQEEKDEVVISFNQRNFALVEYMGENGETRKAYELTEQGFAFVALGFTGEKARRFKVEFINAFFAMREAMQKRFTAEIARSVLPETIAKRQFVYIISNDENSFVKIGVAKDVEKRLKQLQTGSWSTLSVRYKSMVCSNAFSIEKAVHSKVSADRVRGEWYDIAVDEAIRLIEEENVSLETPLMTEYLSGDNQIWKVATS